MSEVLFKNLLQNDESGIICYQTWKTGRLADVYSVHMSGRPSSLES